MPKTKCTCINPGCRVSLELAEKQATGTDLLGKALVPPVRTFQHQLHEMSLGFKIEENNAFAL